ncbi:hypothetical protein OIV83_000989 [Microbotryomycetes sp. JL201]|nr:hypothetical protein OIV83_000989 [Microbotryomycetes sp. JL201]
MSTSHHRAEDYQPNDAYSSYRKPTAPPELRAASTTVSTSRERIAEAYAYKRRPSPPSAIRRHEPYNRSPYRPQDNWDRRPSSSRPTGGWKETSPPRTLRPDVARQSDNPKGKEKEDVGVALRPHREDIGRWPAPSSHVSDGGPGHALHARRVVQPSQAGREAQLRTSANGSGLFPEDIAEASQNRNDTQPASSTVYFSRLPDYAMPQDLDRLLAAYGSILRVSIKQHKSGTGSYAHVVMGSDEQARDVVAALDGTSWQVTSGLPPVVLQLCVARARTRTAAATLLQDHSTLRHSPSGTLFNREPSAERDESDIKQSDSPQKPLSQMLPSTVESHSRSMTPPEPSESDLLLTVNKFVDMKPHQITRSRKGSKKSYVVTYKTKALFPAKSASTVGQPFADWHVLRTTMSEDQHEITLIIGRKRPETARRHSGIETPDTFDTQSASSARTNVSTQAPVAMSVDEDLAGLVDRRPLPPNCIGKSEEAAKARKAFRLSAIKQASAQGKIVLSSSFENNELKLAYEIDTAVQGAPVALPAVSSSEALTLMSARLSAMQDDSERGATSNRQLQALSGASAASTRSPPQPDDIKPNTYTDVPHSALSVPLPSPRRPVYFPLGLNASTAETLDVERNVEEFIKEYFVRFDSSRASLEQFYSNTATFSVRVNPSPPPRCRAPTTPFSNRFLAHSDKSARTPVPIVNVISRLPAGSHNISQFTYDARELPELQSPPGVPNAILLHLQGTVEEFPTHVVRAVRRTFVLVPKSVVTGGIGNPLRFLIQSDTLIYAHFDPDAPSLLSSPPPPPSLAPGSQEPGPRSGSQQTSTSTVPEKRPPSQDNLQEPQPGADAALTSATSSDRHPLQKKRTIARDAAPSTRVAAVRAETESRSPEPVPRPVSDSGPPVIQMTQAQVEALIEQKIAAERQRLVTAAKASKPANGSTTSNIARSSVATSAARPAGSSSARATGSTSAVGPVLVGQTTSVSHGFDGKTNKMRWLVDTGSSLIGVSLLGDVIEYDSHTRGGVRNVAASRGSTFRIDDFAYSAEKSTLIVPYLGAKEGKDWLQPPNQVVLFKRDPLSEVSESGLVEKSSNLQAALPGPETGRLRFVTAGEDKTLFLWTRTRSTGAITTDRLGSDHTSTVTALACLTHKDWILSAGKDKRVIASDPVTQRSVWSTIAPAPVLAVETMPQDPNLVLARLGTANDQFQVYDVRKPNTSVQHFGWTLPLKKSTTTKAPIAPTLGRYLRGSFCDTLYAHPDSESCVKIWDLRQLRSAPKSQTLAVGKSRVIQSMWRSRNEMVLLELNNITTVQLR